MAPTLSLAAALHFIAHADPVNAYRSPQPSGSQSVPSWVVQNRANKNPKARCGGQVQGEHTAIASLILGAMV
jgi:hypothetical protein